MVQEGVQTDEAWMPTVEEGSEEEDVGSLAASSSPEDSSIGRESNTSSSGLGTVMDFRWMGEMSRPLVIVVL